MRGRILLLNPTVTSRRSARFPLSLLSLAAALGDQWSCRIIDGNMERDFITAVHRAMHEESFVAVGVTVMGGPQLQPAIDACIAIRRYSKDMPIIWGGYFPTLYTRAALNAPYVDYAIRGPGESTLTELLGALLARDSAALATISGLAWKRDGTFVCNPERSIRAAHRISAHASPALPYALLGEPRRYLAETFLGKRTAAHQASLGCRFRCTFCGVAAMFGGATLLPQAARFERDITFLKEQLGADSIQYFDHNFFDRQVDMEPLLQVLARAALPWWCYARADALLGMPPEAWTLVRRSKLRMAYIGAESPSDAMLKSLRKGTRVEQTLEVADLCRHQGVIPELSFMVAPPQDTEAETERTFEFIRKIKGVNPHAEIIVYIYTPIPSGSASNGRSSTPLLDLCGIPIQFPQTPEGWCERRWIDYACHADAPWLTDQLRRRIRNFVTVLNCRFPTVQNIRSPALVSASLRALAGWRYRFRHYDRPWELQLARKLSRPSNPQATGI